MPNILQAEVGYEGAAFPADSCKCLPVPLERDEPCTCKHAQGSISRKTHSASWNSRKSLEARETWDSEASQKALGIRPFWQSSDIINVISPIYVTIEFMEGRARAVIFLLLFFCFLFLVLFVLFVLQSCEVFWRILPLFPTGISSAGSILISSPKAEFILPGECHFFLSQGRQLRQW